MEHLLKGETRYIEYKLSYTKTFLKTVSAFANYHNGYIVFGIGDDGNLVGVEDTKGLKLSIEHGINDGIEPVPYYKLESINVPGVDLVVLQVFRGEYTPYTFSGRAYRRRDTSSVVVDALALGELALNGRNMGYDQLVCREDNLCFSIFESRLKREKGIKVLSDDLLKTLELKREEGYTNAAGLLSDSNPLKSSVVNLIAYEDETVKQIIDREILENVSILEQYDACIRFYKKHLNVGERIEGAYRQTIEEVPMVAYREAIANALVHRDYARVVAIRVEIFDDRIEIVSPGSLPLGLSVDEYYDGNVSVIRNEIIADLFHRLHIIERFGTGVNRIKEYYKGLSVAPIFKVYENSVKVILPKRNKSYNVNDDIGNYAANILNDREAIIYELFKEKKALSRTDIEKALDLKRSQSGELLKSMKEKDLIVMVGSGRGTKYVLKN